MSDCEGCFSCDFDCCDCDDDAGCDDDSGCDLCCLCIDVGKFLDSTGKVAFFFTWFVQLEDRALTLILVFSVEMCIHSEIRG